MIKVRSLGYALFIIGLGLAVFALISDRLGLGKRGIQSGQLLLIQLGILLLVTSLGVLQLDFDLNVISLMRQLKLRIYVLPVYIWMLLGLFVTYILLFVFPVFLNSNHAVEYMTRYLPEIKPIGRDLNFNTSSIKNWLDGNGLYDFENHYYPPLYAVVFSPFLLLAYPYNYYVITAVTLFSMVLSGLIIPALSIKDGDRTLMGLLFITGIFSYGMQFELERGQFNIFAFALSLLAIYIFHRHYIFRHLAYLLLSVAIQIKLYPAIFVLMFIKDWRDWKGNILRLVGLGIFNIALLFVLGYRVFVDFLGAIPTLLGAVWVRPYNHSLVSFVNELTTTGLGIFQSDITSLQNYSMVLKIALYLLYFVCLIVVAVRSYKNNDRDINFDLFLICTVGALILPSVSIDYKLPLLTPALILALTRVPGEGKKNIGFTTPIILTLISLAYSFTLFSFVDRPVFLDNCFPLFMVILIGITILNVVEDHKYPRQHSTLELENSS